MEAPKRFFIAAGTAEYSHLRPEEQLPRVKSEITELIELFTERLGFEHVLPRLRYNPDRQLDLTTELRRWFRTAPTEHDVVVFYYGGHGCHDEIHGHYLPLKKSEEEDLFAEAFETRHLAALPGISKVGQLLFILDTCHAEAGAIEIAQIIAALREHMPVVGDQAPYIGLIAASRAKQEADAGQDGFAPNFCHVIRTMAGAQGGYLNLEAVVDRVNALTPAWQQASFTVLGAERANTILPRPGRSEPIPYFICYEDSDGADFARQLEERLTTGAAGFRVWSPKGLQAGPQRGEAIDEALKSCEVVLYVLTQDSVYWDSESTKQWRRAIRYKKDVVLLQCDRDIEAPYDLETRSLIDFTQGADQGMAELTDHLAWRESPEGRLRSLEERAERARRDLRNAGDGLRGRIEMELEQLEQAIAEQRKVVANPGGAARRTQESIERGMERERQPRDPVRGVGTTKFINPPPVVAPVWFQDREVETRQLGAFLADNALRLMTVVGRGGVGKSALVCRLLKALEGGALPDDGEKLDVDGIVYLSALGARPMNLGNLFGDLCRLLPSDSAERLERLYREPALSPEWKMQSLLEAFPGGRTVVLLDNLEALLNPETGAFTDTELGDGLRALLTVPHHGVKVIVTTRVPPSNILLVEGGRQRRLDLDAGLAHPYAENLLREMDADGTVGLKDAPEALLSQARRSTRGYPRALEALFAILAADRDTSLEEILDEAERMLPESVVEALVGEAFSRLDSVAQRVMQALAVYGRPVGAAAVDYLLQPVRPTVDSAPALRRLVNMKFARREGGRYYYLHPVDRDYALGRLPADTSGRGGRGEPSTFTHRALSRRAADYFLEVRKPRADWKTLDDLEPQLSEIRLRIQGGEYDSAAEVLKEIGFDYLRVWGRYRLLCAASRAPGWKAD